MFGNNVNSELYFIYGLIIIVIILIVVILILDKIDSKKKRKSLSDTMSMKPIEDPANFENSSIQSYDMSSSLNIQNDFNIEPIPQVEIENPVYDDIYVEDDLEKTQAQIRVEEITKALKEAKVEEAIEQDKYEKFEEEQEKNAIISYEELKEEFDKLYEENEKRQYLEDDEIPININELYELNEKEEKKLEEHVEETKIVEKEQAAFKSSPYISPVYGIQKPTVEKKDNEIEEANEFLNNLKELKNNLN